MNEQSIYHNGTEATKQNARADHRQTESVRDNPTGYGGRDRESEEHILGYRTRPRKSTLGRFSANHPKVRAGVRFIGHRAEEVNAFWYALATFDLIMAIILFGIVLVPTTTLEPPTQRIEYIRISPIYDSTQHEEVIDVGTLLDESKVYMLARLINGESGSNWCSDTMQLGVGSVVLNRMKSDKFPDTMEEVIFQPGQYSCTNKGSGYWLEPSERAIANAEKLLTEGSIFPDNVLFQANFTQGKGTYLKEQNMYFCY